MSAASWRGAVGPLLVALACLGALAIAPGRDPIDAESSGPVATSSALALLGDPTVGDRLVGWTIVAIDGPRDGTIRIDIGRDRVRFALMVTRIGAMAEPAPVQTEHYAIYYGHVDPPDTVLPANVIRATTNALANRIRAHEDTITVDGM
jgi:hypothetical protein